MHGFQQEQIEMLQTLDQQPVLQQLEWQPPIHTLQLILAELYISEEANSEAQDWEDLNPR
eukprot:scaffold135186_cov68-Attheya_sp.AAC.3